MALIVISGKARAGKDTLGEILKNNFEENYFTLAYADNLKRKVMDDFDLSIEQLYGNLKEVPDERYPKGDGTFWTPREIMQYLGTECYRKIEDGFWVRQLFDIVDRNKLNNVIITDARFPNEVNPVIERGGFHIRIQRDGAGSAQGKEHASEISLDKYENADYIIDNNGTIEDLTRVAKKIIKEIKNG